MLGIKENKENNVCTIEGVDNYNNILKDFWNTVNNKEKISFNNLNDNNIEISNIDNKTIVIINVPIANMKKVKSNYPNNYPNSYPNNYTNQLSQIQMKILEIIQENPTISVKQISEIIDEIKYDAVRWNIAELKCCACSSSKNISPCFSRTNSSAATKNPAVPIAGSTMISEGCGAAISTIILMIWRGVRN